MTRDLRRRELTLPDSSRPEQSRDDVSSRYTNDGIPIYKTSTPTLNVLEGQTDDANTIRAVPESPQRLPGAPSTKAETSKAIRHVRFKDFPASPSDEPHNATSIALPAVAHVRTFRSPALGSLLPVAASEGIARPITLTDGLVARPPHSPPPLSPQRLTVARLYTCDVVCPHRAARYDESCARGDATDGVVEVSERTRDVCWRCSTRHALKLASGLLACCGCGGGERRGEQSDDEELPGWNNV